VPIAAEILRSTDPKFNPVIVTLIPPELGELKPNESEITGESYEKAGYAVPMAFPTSIFERLAAPAPDAARQVTAVLVVHPVVPHIVAPIDTDGVASALPKFTPFTVTLRDEVCAMLPGLM
jgi:hypothetical protein